MQSFVENYQAKNSPPPMKKVKGQGTFPKNQKPGSESPKNKNSGSILKKPHFLSPITELRIIEQVYPLANIGKKNSNWYPTYGIFKHKKVTSVTFHSSDGVKEIDLRAKINKRTKKGLTFKKKCSITFLRSTYSTLPNK